MSGDQSIGGGIEGGIQFFQGPHNFGDLYSRSTCNQFTGSLMLQHVHVHEENQ